MPAQLDEGSLPDCSLCLCPQVPEGHQPIPGSSTLVAVGCEPEKLGGTNTWTIAEDVTAAANSIWPREGVGNALYPIPQP